MDEGVGLNVGFGDGAGVGVGVRFGDGVGLGVVTVLVGVGLAKKDGAFQTSSSLKPRPQLLKTSIKKTTIEILKNFLKCKRIFHGPFECLYK